MTTPLPRDPPVVPRVAGVVLAAGRSTRLGQPKQLLPLHGRPLLQHVIDAACGSILTEVVVVLGAAASDIAALVTPVRARMVVNEHFAHGQSTSLHAGLHAVGTEVHAVVFLLGDQPGVTPALINRLVASYGERRARIVAPTFADGIGNPVLFDRALWPELLAITGDTGARDVLRTHRNDVATVPVEGNRLSDIDTWADYQHLSAPEA